MKSFEALGKMHTQCCATCRHWKPEPKTGSGWCEQIVPYDKETNLVRGLKTLDLSLCSKWQEKDTEE